MVEKLKTPTHSTPEGRIALATHLLDPLYVTLGKSGQRFVVPGLLLYYMREHQDVSERAYHELRQGLEHLVETNIPPSLKNSDVSHIIRYLETTDERFEIFARWVTTMNLDGDLKNDPNPLIEKLKEKILERKSFAHAKR